MVLEDVWEALNPSANDLRTKRAKIAVQKTHPEKTRAQNFEYSGQRHWNQKFADGGPFVLDFIHKLYKSTCGRVWFNLRTSKTGQLLKKYRTAKINDFASIGISSANHLRTVSRPPSYKRGAFRANQHLSGQIFRPREKKSIRRFAAVRLGRVNSYVSIRNVSISLDFHQKSMYQKTNNP